MEHLYVSLLVGLAVAVVYLVAVYYTKPQQLRKKDKNGNVTDELDTRIVGAVTLVLFVAGTAIYYYAKKEEEEGTYRDMLRSNRFRFRMGCGCDD
jgi:nitrogen fixation/metabolism regulation signal transduction histidine kinase